MPRDVDFAYLKTQEWNQLQEVADRLEQAWNESASVDLAQFLPPVDDAQVRAIYLEELIKTDLEMRWQRGQVVGLEYYLEKFPELGRARAVSPQLLYEEYRVRHIHGDKPEPSIYQRRFPEQFAEFERLVREQPIRYPAAEAPAPADPADPRPALPPGSGYRLLRCIGRGSFGSVWSAEAPGGFKAAIKIILRPLTSREAQRELQALELIKKLGSHPFLVQTQAYWSLKDRLYIVQELADGNLLDRLRECHGAGQPGIPLPELAGYFREAAEALDFLHSKQVLHRDIKPSNLLLVNRHAKVGDFGLARLHVNWRTVSSTAGTPAYMAPETWRRKVGPPSDQYALALTYAELRLRRRLFPGTTLDDIKRDHLHRTPQLDPLPRAEQQVLLKALAKAPEHRYRDCRQFAYALERALEPELQGLKAPMNVMLDGTSLDLDEGGTAIQGQGAEAKGQAARAPAGAGVATGNGLAPPRPTADQTLTEREKDVRRRSGERFLIGAAVVLLLASTALLGWRYLTPGSFQLKDPGSLVLAQGQGKSHPIELSRQNFTRPIELTVTELPPGVRVTGGMAVLADSARLWLQAADDAPPGAGTVTIEARGADLPIQRVRFSVIVTAKPPEKAAGRPSEPRP